MPDVFPLHAALARALRDLQVDTLFGLMGDANLFLCDAFMREDGGRFVPAVHENGATLMALGYAAVTGKVGVASITQGPALSNATTALIEGVRGNLPVVLLCGDIEATDADHLQAVPQEPLVAATGAGFVALQSPDTALRDLARAFAMARDEHRPVVVDMPTEMMWEDVEYAGLEPIGTPTPPARVEEGQALDDAIGIIAAARRPLILAGRGALGAREELLRLARRIGAPVATTLMAKGLFDGEAFDLGVCGTISTPAATEVVGAADCIIAFGAGLNRFTTAHGALLKDKRLIQVDAKPDQLGRRAQPDAALAGDPGQVAETFLHWLDEAEIPSSQSTDTIDAAALRAPLARPKSTRSPGTLDYFDALDRIDAALPRDRVFVTDGGRFMTEAWCRIGVRRPRDFVQTVHFGAIGMGMGYAIGAAVACPDRQTLFLSGDGGFMMGGLSEFSSAVREQLNLVTVICNDSAYGAEFVQFEDRKLDPQSAVFDWPSFAGMAQAMGATGLRVDTSESLDAALDQVARTSGPILLELILDPAAMPRMHV